MSDATIVFDSVWKKYRKGERLDSLRDLAPALVRSLRRGGRMGSDLTSEEFWALRDVSFEVRPGQALGIIGPNGAGKSTTLKLLTKILKPTRGRSRVRGRVGALIEIAAGFHADLTGRENVYLQGAIMGMPRAEVTRAFDAIVDFAGVEEFIDTPVKRYSSGMNARLGFSIAAHLHPDALIIDEVLSVGDVAFQQKCIERMRRFKREGAAIVFVSHNLQAVSSLCDRAIYLKGAMEAEGDVSAVIQRFLSDTDFSTLKAGTGGVSAVNVELTTAGGAPTEAVRPGDALVLTVQWRANETIEDYHVGFLLYRSTDGLRVYDGNWTGQELQLPRIESGTEFSVKFAFRANLTRGHYHLASHVYHNPTQQIVGQVQPAALFAVDEQRTWAGVADLEVQPVLDAPGGGRRVTVRRTGGAECGVDGPQTRVLTGVSLTQAG